METIWKNTGGFVYDQLIRRPVIASYGVPCLHIKSVGSHSTSGKENEGRKEGRKEEKKEKRDEKSNILYEANT